jgi:bacteriorhodopsin
MTPYIDKDLMSVLAFLSYLLLIFLIAMRGVLRVQKNVLNLFITLTTLIFCVLIFLKYYIIGK